MNNWLIRIGITLIVIAVALISPLKNYLPVDWWPSLVGSVGSMFDSGPKHEYFKVVPATEVPSYVHIYVLIALGIFLVAFGKFYKPKVEKQ